MYGLGDEQALHRLQCWRNVSSAVSSIMRRTLQKGILGWTQWFGGWAREELGRLAGLQSPQAPLFGAALATSNCFIEPRPRPAMHLGFRNQQVRDTQNLRDEPDLHGSSMCILPWLTVGLTSEWHGKADRLPLLPAQNLASLDDPGSKAQGFSQARRTRIQGDWD